MKKTTIILFSILIFVVGFLAGSKSVSDLIIKTGQPIASDSIVVVGINILKTEKDTICDMKIKSPYRLIQFGDGKWGLIKDDICIWFLQRSDRRHWFSTVPEDEKFNDTCAVKKQLAKYLNYLSQNTYR